MTKTRTLQERLAQFAGDARVTMTNGSAGQLLMTAGALTAEAVTALDAKDALLREAEILLRQLAAGNVDVSGTAIIIGFPQAKATLDAIRSLLPRTEAQK